MRSVSTVSVILLAATLSFASLGCSQTKKAEEPETTERAHNYDKIRNEFMEEELTDIVKDTTEQMETIVDGFVAYAAPLDAKEKDSKEYFDRLHEAEEGLESVYNEGCMSIAALKSYDEGLADYDRYWDQLDEVHDRLQEQLHQ